MTALVVLLNTLASALGTFFLAPIAVLPGWLSATLVAVATGAAALVIYRHTSRQDAIKRARARIQSNLLALSLFRDSVGVGLRCQGRVLAGACRLLLLSIVPMLVMTPPMCLLLAQLSLWYEARPLRVGEEAVVTAQMAPGGDPLPELRLDTADAARTTVGPVRVASKRIVCWNIRAEKPGRHSLTLEADGRKIEKELSVGDGFMQVSVRRPAREWSDAILHPRETPLPSDSPIESVTIDYPHREGWITGSGWWVVYWFVVSMLAALFLRPWLNVNI